MPIPQGGLSKGEIDSCPSSPCSTVRWNEHFAEKYHRIKKRRGDGKAIVTVAREIAVARFYMLTRREPYRFSSEASVSGKLKRPERKVKNVFHGRLSV